MMKTRIHFLLLSLLLAVTPLTAQEKAPFEAVDLDTFFDDQKAFANGRKIITMAAPVGFEARLKRHPEPRKLQYVYTALEVGGVSPLPVVEHRMFVESDGGRVIPVYVDKAAAAWIDERVKEGQRLRFVGYHLYSYAKGPAILVTGFEQPAGAASGEAQ